MIYALATLRTRAMADATHAEPGCMFYELTININDRTQWIFVEH